MTTHMCESIEYTLHYVICDKHGSFKGSKQTLAEADAKMSTMTS